MAYNRRSFLKSASAAAAGGMLGLASPPKIGAAEVVQVKLTLPWLPLGTYTYPFVTKRSGPGSSAASRSASTAVSGPERCACRSTRGNTTSA